MKNNLRYTALASAVAFALAVSGCGHHHHHHDDVGPEPEPQPQPQPEPDDGVQLQGQVIDGYLEKVTVCADLNLNNACDEDEPYAETKADGTYSLVLSPAALAKITIGHFRILAKAPKSTKNHIYGGSSALTSPLMLSSTVFLDDKGALTQESSNITPYSTLASLTMRGDKDGKIAESDYTTRVGDVAEDLGVSRTVALTDYNADSTNKDSLKALIAAETLVRSNLLPRDESEMANIADNALITADSVKESTNQYKDMVEDVSGSIDKEISAGKTVTGDQIAGRIAETEAKLGSSFREINSGLAEDWRCGVTRNNNVFCWGNNSWGSLGDPELFEKAMAAQGKTLEEEGSSVIDNFSAEPVAVKILAGTDSEGNNVYIPLTNVRTVALGNLHACAVTYAGEVYCWGGNYRGQLGVAEEIISSGENANYRAFYAQKVLKGQQDSSSGYLSNVESLSLGQNSTCAVTRDGEVYCWGDNTSSRLGSPYYEGYSYNYSWREMNDQLEIEMSSGKGGLACNPASADCEPEFIQIVPVPVKVKFPDAVASVKRVVTGLWASCALTENKSEDDHHNLYCWGGDSVGTVTHNFGKHFAELSEKYLGKKSRYGTYNFDEPWNWKIFESNGEYHPLFGEPVTAVDSIPVIDYDSDAAENQSFSTEADRDEFIAAAASDCLNGTNGREAGCIVEPWYDDNNDEKPFNVAVWNIARRIDISNVTDVALMSYDDNVLLVMTPATDIYDTSLPGVPGLYGVWNNSMWMDMDLSDQQYAQLFPVKRIITSEDRGYYLLTEAGQLFYKGQNRFGMAGQNNSDVTANVEGLVLSPDGETPLSHVVDVSMGKRSVCASTRKVEVAADGTETEDSAKFDMLCWGSSVFGQLGFDNGDGGFSFGQAASAWNGASNMYLDKETRYLTVPLEVTSCMFNGTGCPEAPEPEPEIVLDLSDLEFEPEDGYVYISVVDPSGETLTMGSEANVDLYWWPTGASDPAGTDPEPNLDWMTFPFDPGITWKIHKDDDSDATVLTYKIPVAGYGDFCGIPRKGTAEGDKLFLGNFCQTYSDDLRKLAFRLFTPDKVTENLNDLFEQE